MQDFTQRAGVTLSAGIATYAEWMETDDVLLDEARKALEVAQISGGNRTELHAERPPPSSE